MPLNESNLDELVNVLEYWEIHPDGEVQHFSWITDFLLIPENVWDIMRGGRAWDCENSRISAVIGLAKSEKSVALFPVMEGPLFHGWSRTWQSLGGKAKEATSYRSPWRVLARAFEKSRDLWKAKYKALQERIKAFRTEVRDLRRSRDRWRAKAEALEQEIKDCVPRCNSKSSSPPRAEPAVTTGPDPAFELIPARHQFSLVQILLMLGWVLRGMSLRGTCSAVDWMHEMAVDWGFDFPVPHFTTVRFWLLRLGYHKLHRPKEQASDWVWIIDHSNQIGQEKCFVILGVRLSQLPPPGPEFPLRLSQMEPIELEPVTVSDKEVVYRQLEANVAKTGVPRAIIDDHGGDLAGGVELFCQAHPETIEIYDISHKAACLLKARLERDEQWKAFAAKAGQTKCSIQQTEWAFLIPPSQRFKARYMNLGPLIAWGVNTLAILDNPGPEVLKYGTKERLEEKLGWLRQFRERLKGWSEMEQTIDVLDFVRTQGLYRGAAKDLRKRLGKLPVGQSAAQLRDDLTKFVADQARQLRPGERLPATSEVIESSFGKFKTVERDQAKGGFTGLLLALAACVAERTQEVVHEALQKTRTRDVIAWIKTKLGNTVGSKRRIAYQAAEASVTDANKSKSETKPEGSRLPSVA